MSKKNNPKSAKSKTTAKRNTPTPRTPAKKIAQPSVASPVVQAPVASAPVMEAPMIDISPMVERLRDAWAERAVDAIEQLAAANDDRAVAPIIDVLTSTEGYYHVVTRAAAAMALGRLGRDEAVDVLINATRDQQAEVSCEAVLALGEMRATRSVPVLLDIVLNPSNFYLNVTRHAAVRALGRIGDVTTRATLEQVAHSAWEDAAIVAAAREAIARM